MTQSVCESASRQPAVLPASMRVGIARGRVKLGLIFSFNGAFLPSSSERPSECVAYLPRAPATEPGSVGPTPRRIQGQQWRRRSRRSVHSRSLDGWMSAVLTLETVGILDGDDGWFAGIPVVTYCAELRDLENECSPKSSKSSHSQLKEGLRNHSNLHRHF